MIGFNTGSTARALSARARGRGSPRILLSCMALLLLVLALNGILSLGALRTMQRDSFAARAKVVGYDWALRIQGAIRFGKPIEQFYGMDEALRDIHDDLPAVATVAVVSASGDLLALEGQPVSAQILANVVGRANGKVGGSLQRGDRYFQAFPILGRDGAPAGALVTAIADAAIADAVEPLLKSDLVSIGLIATIAALVLFLGFRLLGFGRAVGPEGGPPRWQVYALIMGTIAVAQGAHAYLTFETFHGQYLAAVRETANLALFRTDRDLDRLFAKGVRIDHLSGIEQPFKRIMAQAPEIGFMEIADAEGRVLYRVYRDGSIERSARPLALSPDFDATRALGTPKPGGDQTLGVLRMRLSESAIAAGAFDRVLDAGTLMLVSVLFAVELLVVLIVLLKRQPDANPNDDGHHILARPAAFLLLTSWALPLSFIPLRMRELAVPVVGWPEHLVLALPLSAEMFCALITAILAGAVTDRRGWQAPFLTGVGLSMLGEAVSAVADTPLAFVLARAVVGSGYGLAWMGIQGFIVTKVAPGSRAQGLSHLVAGIFAGHICGSSVGAMLAQQLGFGAVFAASAVIGLLPGLFALVFMHPYLAPTIVSKERPPTEVVDWRAVKRLLSERRFAWLLAGSVLPFSIAQVGLLYLTVPLLMSDQGFSQANIGRVMMVYGLSVIYLGPLIGRRVDTSRCKKNFIVMGGLIGSVGLLYLFVDQNLLAISAAVFLLGLASALSTSAQTAFALELPAVQTAGAGTSMGVHRAADKLGQMLGPLLVGALISSLGAGGALAICGLLYLSGTVAFAVFARRAAPA